MQTPIDLRSDTVTKPTPAMRAAIAAAAVGDDVFQDDPTVLELQDKVASLLGKEAALFVPSGTMANQIAIKVHTQPGDELLCDANSHVFTWEAGGPAFFSGVTCRALEGDYGVLDLSQLRDKIRPNNEHYTRSRLVCLENTHNRGGGRVYPQQKIIEISRWAHTHQLKMHLDGARLWNAHVASGLSLRELAQAFDSVSVCFSKGLGAPIGSALLGTADFIAQARRLRKLFGGGMRQVGMIAAAASYALDNHIARLADDHRHAQIIASAINDTPGLRLDPSFVETNLVWFAADPELGTATEIVSALEKQGIRLSALESNTLRACTHLDVSASQTEYVAETLRKLGQGKLSGVRG